MAQLIATDPQQKDNLCGPFCAARILNVEQDLVALRAGTRVPPPSPHPSVPPGATSRTDYRHELPQSSLAESGTSAEGLKSAIESLSGGGLRCVPIRGQWTAERVEGLVGGATALGARLIANIRTGRLWGSRPSAEQLLSELRGEKTDGPPPDWDVGHFVELKLLVLVTSGKLVVVHDTYPSLGHAGYHLQPPRVLAEALMRGDGREGGVLAVAPEKDTDALAQLARGLGLEVALWDNGSRS